MLSAKNLYRSIFLCVLPRWCKFLSLQLCLVVLRAPRSQASLGPSGWLCVSVLGTWGGSGAGLWQGGGGWWVLNLLWSHQPSAGGAQGGSVHAELWPFSKPSLSLPSDYDSASGTRILALKLDFSCYCAIWAIYSTSSGLSFCICNEVYHSSYPLTYRSMTFLCLHFLSDKPC